MAISDELIPNLIRALYDPILAAGGISGVGSTGGASTPGYAVLPMQFVNTPNSGGSHLGSAYDGGYEGYLVTSLEQLLGQHPADAFGNAITNRECNGGPSTCGAAIDAALLKTYNALVTANGSSQRAGVDGVDGFGCGEADDAGLRRDRVPRAGRHHPAGHRLAEPADVPAGDRIPAAPPR